MSHVLDLKAFLLFNVFIANSTITCALQYQGHVEVFPCIHFTLMDNWMSVEN